MEYHTKIKSSKNTQLYECITFLNNVYMCVCVKFTQILIMALFAIANLVDVCSYVCHFMNLRE